MADSENTNPSLVIAQLALGLAGFASISTAIQHGDSATAEPAWRLLSMLSICFGALFLALMHYFLRTVQVAEKPATRASSALMATYGVAWGLYMVPAIFNGTVKSGWISITVFAIGVLNCLAQMLNALGRPWCHYGIFLAGLIWYLLAGVFTLMSMITFPVASGVS